MRRQLQEGNGEVTRSEELVTLHKIQSPKSGYFARLFLTRCPLGSLYWQLSPSNLESLSERNKEGIHAVSNMAPESDYIYTRDYVDNNRYVTLFSLLILVKAP